MRGGAKDEMGIRNDTKKLAMDVQPAASSSINPEQTSTVSKVPEKGRRKLKLRDHTKRVHGRIRRNRVAIAYKRVRYRNFVRNHTRRIHELYFLQNPTGNFLDSVKYMHKKQNEKPRSLSILLEVYKLPDQVQLVPVVTRVDVPKPKTENALEKQPEKHLVELISQPPLESNSLDRPFEKQLVKLMNQPPLAKLPPDKLIVKSANQLQPMEMSTPSKSPEKPTTARGPKKFSEKMKAEASVVQRVVELQKEGMWYDKRLPKCYEQPRIKTHWDYLLEEMVWLATDFAAEKKWKRIAARKCAKMVEKYHADKKLLEEKTKKDEKVRVQKIAAFMAKEVRNFWSNVRKLVEYKEQTKIEELRKKTMDQHLSFIVDQTERISSILAESFSTEIVPHRLALQKELVPDSISDLKIFADGMGSNLSDDEFLPSQESDDDEETISLADIEASDVRGEVALLKKESEMSIDAVLDDLPTEYVEALLTGKGQAGQPEDIVPSFSDSSDQKGETDYEPSESESDFEDTILEEEKLEAAGPRNNAAAELKELEEENQLSIEQLRAKYMKSSPAGSDNDSDVVDSGDINDSDDEDEENASELFGDYRNSAEDDEQQSSLATLLQTFAPDRAGEDHGDDELNSVAAMAESFQPKGYTLCSTTVATKVPPLLKHTLREYQHIGLDWLVTMHDKKLNGILADEMGLGKTIQTIALLAHLACEKGNWGPHLIIVPTSVMLNWEMELLKWFPGCKVLTYYGSIKERKVKRTGWTKPNTFHVCITSYKILIQDHQAFRRKRWKYLILDEAQNIKNFKSQRWQLLLNFSTNRRLLLTGTPLQNNLMELWSLMHFLMPNVFQSHREFREWFSNPMTGMIEGNSEYNENIIRRLHKVLRPFILRRLKCEVEKQLPQKYEHIVLCRLSKRQRYLYEDFMSRAKTKETLQTGSLLSVINVLMQLRKVCNHPNLFEPRPIISPLQTRGFPYMIPSLVWNMNDDLAEKTVTHNIWNVTSNELSLDRTTAEKLRYLGMQNFCLNVRRIGGSAVLESISLPPSKVPRGAESFKNMIDISHASDDDIAISTDGDEDCSIIFENKNDSSIVKKTIYSFQKSVVPNPPRLRTPFAIFTMETYPPGSLINDREFIAALALQTEGETLDSPHHPNPLLPSAKHVPLATFVGIPKESKLNSPLLVKPRRKPRITKLSTSQYPLKLATTPNGSEVMVTANGVYVQPPERPRQIKTTNIPYASRGAKRKKVNECENKSLLDTIVVDFEDPPEQVPCHPPETISSETVPATKTNGVEDEGTDEYEDSEEESQAPLRKMPRLLEKPARRKKRQNSGPVKISKYTEIDEDEDSGRAGPSARKRKRSPTSSQAGRAKGNRLDFSSVDFEDVVYRRLCDRKAVITNLRSVNNQRLHVHSVYGSDSLYQTTCFGVMPRTRYYEMDRSPPYSIHLVSAQPEERYHDSEGYFNLGYQEVLLMSRIKSSLTSKHELHHPFNLWRHTKGLRDAVWTLHEVMEMFANILKRFVVYTPAVAAPRIQQPTVFHPSVSRYAAIQSMEQKLSMKMTRPLEPLRPIISSMTTQFPDPRLIQYDCGKLQVMDGLLRRLKSENHRILIFTQMAKMLDILEAFLNHHGYIYLRLDGATKIDQRQLLMERFNTDKRIFCFILSTRSGGIGVNLTGADTVIFYDSDWNPTMDAQAQDRCHRIGQTRDVHIYRLVSEKTVEENILKKSNQKKLLGELAIEGGNFTTAHFKKNTIHDIFVVDEGEGDATKRMAEVLDTPVPSPVSLPVKTTEFELEKKEDSSKKSATYMFESALAAAEDDSDVQAARTVRAEAAAELAEFDENIPLDDEVVEVDEPSPIEQEMEFITNELSRVEVYALRFMERTIDDWSKDTYANVQKELELQKLDWDLEGQPDDHKALLRKPPPFADTFEEQLEDLLTYQRLPQAHWYDEEKGCFRMPVYGPPTPPQDDEDIYIDSATALLYDISATMPDHLLPRVWQGPKKSKGSSTDISPTKSVEEIILESNIKRVGLSTGSKINRRDEPIFAPRSLFDRPSPALAKLRRDYKIQKLSKTGSRFPGAVAIGTSGGQGASKTLGSGAITLPVTSPKAPLMSYPTITDILEWNVPEDNQLLQSMTHIIDLPANLLIVNLAQTPNWDFTTEVVNTVSRIYRSTKHCKARYEQVILPREEGKYVEPVPLQKKKKSKSFVKISTPLPPKGRRLKTSEIVANDNNRQYRNMFSKKFDAMKAISKERIPAGNPLSINTTRVPKQHSVFSEHNINFDTPLSSPSIAFMRHERVMADRAKIIAAQRAHQAEQLKKASEPPPEVVPVSPKRTQGDGGSASVSPSTSVLIESPRAPQTPASTGSPLIRSDVIALPAEPIRPRTVTATSASNVFVQLASMQGGSKITQSPQSHLPTQTLSPIYANRSDSTSSSPEQARPPSSASNIFVQLTGLSSSPKLNQSPGSSSPNYSPTTDGSSSSSPEITRPMTVSTPGNNIFVQLTGIPPGTKLTQSQIQQLRQSILQQSSKGYVNVVTSPTSQQQVRHESTTQQVKRIQIVPTTHANIMGTSPSPTQITIPVSTSLPPPPTAMASQSLNPLTATPAAGGGNIVAINTGIGTRLMKQQIVGGKSVTRPISEADIQMLLKLRGASATGTNINVPAIVPSGFSPQVSTVGGTGIGEQGDMQATPIAIPMSTISGLQTAHSQGHSIILPTKVTPAPAGTFSHGSTGRPAQTSVGSQLISVPISQAQVIKPIGMGPQVSLVRGQVPPGSPHVAPSPLTQVTQIKYSPIRHTTANLGSLTEQGDGQGKTISIPVSSISGLQAAQSQGHPIIFPTKGTIVTSGAFTQGVAVSTVPAGTQLIAGPITQTHGVKPANATICVQKGFGASPQVSLVRGPVPPGNTQLPLSPLVPVKYSPLRQPTATLSSLVDYQKAQPYGIVSAMSRNTCSPPRQSVNQTLDPRFLRSQHTVTVPGKDNTINVTTRPLVPNPGVRSQFYTPVSQISLVRGTVPIVTTSTSLTSIPVTYSAAKMSLLKQSIPAGESPPRPQLLQRPQQILTIPIRQTAPTYQAGTPTQASKGLDPPQLIVNSFSSTAPGVFTMYTTTASTLPPTPSTPTSTNPPTSE